MNAVLADFHTWFESYAQSFSGKDNALNDAVKLKYDHTLRVIDEIKLLCTAISADKTLTFRAIIAALFHDVARFEQFRTYRTFSDKKSENHAEMGVAIIDRFNLFDALDADGRLCITQAIRYHNAALVPDHLSSDRAFLCRMLRDADKLDIYRIALDYYVNPDPQRKETIQVGIPDGIAVTRDVCDHILTGTVVPYEKIRTVTDFKMIQLGWVFDLNFRHSLSCVKERGYIEAICGHLPQSDEVTMVVESVCRYLDDEIEKEGEVMQWMTK